MFQKKEEPKFKSLIPKGIFKERSVISRIEFEKTALKRYVVPGGGGKIWGKREIKEMIEKDFPKEKFRRITKKEFQKRLGELAIEKSKAKTGMEKKEIEQRIRFYRRRFLR